MPKSVTVVTGGAGFIGSHLASYLSDRGKRVVAIDNGTFRGPDNLQLMNIKAEFIEKSITDPAVFESLESCEVDTIYHLASPANVPFSVRRPLEDFKVNMQGTLNVLEFAREKKAQVIFPSTVSVYAKDSAKPISEKAEIHASSPYAAAKIGGENYCYAYTNCYGVRTVVARLFNVYGPGMNKYVIHDFIRKLQANPKSLTIMGTGQQVREYTYIDDVVRAFVLLAERGESGTAYNVGTGIPVRIIDLAKMIIEEMGLKDVELICTNEEAVGDIQEWYGDITRLNKLGFEPQVAFREGLKRTIKGGTGEI
ncbi:MAG: NAD-dependent epimerase/dehydratase family protein [Candidatus Omnitrophota bacterium]